MNRRLTVTIDPSWKTSLRQEARRAFSGEIVGEILSFSSPELFLGRLTPKRLALLSGIQGQAPLSIRQIARLLGRDVRRVHDDIQVLLELGLIEKTSDGKILCPYEDIHLVAA